MLSTTDQGTGSDNKRGKGELIQICYANAGDLRGGGALDEEATKKFLQNAF